MKLSLLSPETQEGLNAWAHVRGNNLLFVHSQEAWAWIWFQLRVAEDRPEWFPKGKWATLQVIAMLLEEDARRERVGI